VEQTRNLRKAMRDFDRLGTDWTIADVAAEVGLETDRAELLLSRGRTVSLDEPLESGPRARPVGATIADEEAVDPCDHTILGQEVVNMLQATARLDDRHRYVITKRYGLEDSEFRSLSAIAREMDLSRERVRQLEKEALEEMRHSGIRSQRSAA
jgi:RNA polymerase nonessential primary-like sigma factor